MSDYGPTIETLDDWNAQLGCCCAMPSCPIPVQVCESISAETSGDYYVPFTAPGVDPYEEIPRLYLDADGRTNIYYSGTAWVFASFVFDGGDQQHEALSLATFAEDVDFDGTLENFVDTANEYHTITLVCGPAAPTVGHFNPSAATPFDFEGVEITCTETTSARTDVYHYLQDPTPPALHGCPGPLFAGEDPVNTEGGDVYRNEYEADILSVPVTKTDLTTITTDALAALEALGLPWPDTACESVYRIQHITGRLEEGWPTTGSLAENLTPWPSCTGDDLRIIPVWIKQVDVRYRWQVPDTFEGSYFKITWDVLTEPLGWDDTIDDPDYEPPIPNDPPEPVPQVPRPDRPVRSLEEDLTWEWAGPGDPEDVDSWLSDWYELDPPTVVGTKRVVNVRFECYRSPYGQKPQITGEAVTLPDS